MSELREVLAAADRRESAVTAGVTGIDPRVRIVVAIAFAVVVVSIDSLRVLGVALVLALALVLAARLPAGRTFARVAALDALVLGSVILLPFTMPGTELVRVGPFPASAEGSLAAVRILMKATAVLLAVVSLVGTLDAVQLAQALRRLAVPAKLVSLLLFTVRYIEVLAREQGRLRTAMKARAFTMRTDLHTWHSVGYLVGMILVRSFERAERVFAAMKCRGFTGAFPSCEAHTLGRCELIFAGGWVVVFAVLMGLDRL